MSTTVAATQASTPGETVARMASETWQNAERLALAMEVTEDGLWDCDLPTGRLVVNRQWLAMLGHTEEEFVPHLSSFERLCHPDDFPEVMARIDAMLRGEEASYRFEHRLRHREGHYIWVLGRAKIVGYGVDGKPCRVIGTTVDITAQKQAEYERDLAESRQRESESRLRQTVESVRLGLWDWDIPSGVVERDERCLRLLGYEPGELSDRLLAWKNSLHPEDRPRVLAVLTNHLEDPDHLYEVDYRVRTKAGDYIWVMTRGNIVEWDAQGKPLRMIGTIQDITDRKQQEQARQESEARFALAINAMHDGLVVQNTEGEIVMLNARAQEILGLTEDQMRGRSSLDPRWRAIQEDGSPFQGDAHPAMVSLRTGKPCHNVVMGVHKPDGTLNWININTRPLFQEQAIEPYAVVCTFADITERQHLEAELVRSNNALQDFASIASHDLKEPLRKIQTFGSMLPRKIGDMPPEARDYLDRMMGATARMQSLIDGLLSYSRVTLKGERFLPTDLNGVIQEVLADLDLRVQETEASITVEQMPVLSVDALQMRQLFQNLISNALKFRKPDRPCHIHIGYASQGNRHVITLQDNGLGFAASESERIFELFERLHGTASEGTGIGLAICRKIVERHSGTLTATGVPNEGSTFTISL